MQEHFQRGRHQDELAQERRLPLRQGRPLRQGQTRKGGQQIQVRAVHFMLCLVIDAQFVEYFEMYPRNFLNISFLPPRPLGVFALSSLLLTALSPFPLPP